MNHDPQNPLLTLNRHISGFHQYCLTPVPRLSYVSDNLCHMLGLTEQQLLGGREDSYASLLHPADRAAYAAFLEELGREPKSLTGQYRLIKPDGTVLFVSDSMTSYRCDGIMMADSVLTDITALKNENRNLQFLNDTIPCGFLKYTCEKTPRVTYINDRMLRILRFPEERQENFDDLQLYMQNIYTMIPVEERGRFSRYLDRVYEQGAPLAGEMTALRCDGTRARIFGWVTKCVNERGEEEFQSAFMDITDRYLQRKKQESGRYLKALTEVYDRIFEYDLANRTVKCLCGQDSPMFRWLENIPMQMEEATENWITGTVEEGDRERLRAFFRDLYRKKLVQPDGRPGQIRYRARSSDGTVKTYTGILLKLDESVSLYCVRRAPETWESENGALKNMQELAMRFTEGVVAFEVENDRVRPLYTSDNVCSFFGCTREQWLALAEKRPTVREFVALSGIAYDDIKTLFAVGEAEFTYFDMTQNAYRRIRAICSPKYDGTGRCHVMLYNVDAKEQETVGTDIRIRTFGYFDVFVDDKPIAFRNEKSKELFALLVDRRGGFVSSEEAISFLWEEEPANPVTLARYRKVALRLKNILEEYGVADIVESVNGKRRLVTEKVRCDLYEYLSGREEYVQLFKGSYLTNYSWSENTLAELMGKHLRAGE